MDRELFNYDSGFLSLNEANHNENGNPHPQYVVSRDLNLIPVRPDADHRWYQLAEFTIDGPDAGIFAVIDIMNRDSSFRSGIKVAKMVVKSCVSGKLSQNMTATFKAELMNVGFDKSNFIVTQETVDNHYVVRVYFENKEDYRGYAWRFDILSSNTVLRRYDVSHSLGYQTGIIGTPVI